MDATQIATKLVLDELGLKPKLNTFDKRLVIQKSIYLVQAAGLDLGYYFSWYLRGPYASSLTKDAFAIESAYIQGADDSSEWRLGQDSISVIRKIKQLMIDCPRDLEQPKYLELLASVHFLHDRKSLAVDDAAAIHEVLKRYGKTYSIEQVREAIQTLRTAGLIQ